MNPQYVALAGNIQSTKYIGVIALGHNIDELAVYIQSTKLNILELFPLERYELCALAGNIGTLFLLICHRDL